MLLLCPRWYVMPYWHPTVVFTEFAYIFASNLVRISANNLPRPNALFQMLRVRLSDREPRR